MFENNGHDPLCSNAVDIVAYLYNEIGETEKRQFESHLAGCKNCSTELNAFSGVRSSVADWRVQEFDPLSTPVIEVPFETREEPAVVSGWRGTILTDLKKLFAFSPWPPAAVGFAALAIFIGLGFFAFSYLNQPGSDFAENRNIHKPGVLPTVDPGKKSDEVASVNNNTQPKGEDKVTTAVKAPENTAVKVADTQTAPKNKAVKSGPDTVTPKRAVDKTTTNQKAPKLNNYTEEEDTTLRLADLFEEIDTKE